MYGFVNSHGLHMAAIIYSLCSLIIYLFYLIRSMQDNEYQCISARFDENG